MSGCCDTTEVIPLYLEGGIRSGESTTIVRVSSAYYTSAGSADVAAWMPPATAGFHWQPLVAAGFLLGAILLAIAIAIRDRPQTVEVYFEPDAGTGRSQTTS